MSDPTQRARSRPPVAAYLEVARKGARNPRRIIIGTVPFVMGRGEHATLTFDEEQISTEHAALELRGDRYVLCDLDSTNGTFVNGDRVDERVLEDRDVIHLAHVEVRFRLGRPARRTRSTLNVDDAEQQKLVRLASALNEVLTTGSLVPVYQPIVRLDDGALVGVESLGRTSEGLAELSFGGILKIADERGQAATLSQVMREIALNKLPAMTGWIFFNLHPQESVDLGDLERSFDRIVQRLGSGQTGVIEVSESAVTDLEAMGRVRDAIKRRGLLLAYDDFGAGQSRLRELVEVPPDFLKLDMGLVRDIDADKSRPRRELLRALIASLAETEVTVVAEGIEREGEAEVCRELGCVLGQGYLFGYPSPAEEIGG